MALVDLDGLREVSDSINAFFERNHNMIAQLERVSKEIRSSFLTLQRGLFDPNSWEALSAAWDVRQKEAAKILGGKGWWLDADMDIRLLDRVVRLNEARRRRQINRLMCDYYSPRRLRSIIAGWNDQPLFEARRHIIEHARWAHAKGRWYLVIPILLTQIEGVLQDFAAEEGLPKKRTVKKIAKALHLEDADPKQVISNTWLAQLDAMFASGYYKTRPRQRGLRRNAILHGHELHYGSELRSTQLFLQLHTIHWLISEKNAKKAA